MSEPSPTIDRFSDLVERGDVDGALALIQSALDNAITTRTPKMVVHLVGHALGPLVDNGHRRRALTLVDTTLSSLSDSGGSFVRGWLLAASAGLLRHPRRFAEALGDQNEAIELLAAHLPDQKVTTLRHDRAVLLADLGNFEDAVAGLVAAREAFLGLRDQVGVAASDHNLGCVLHDLGALDDAIEYLTEARDIFLAIEMPEEAAACDQNMAVIFYDLGRLKDAGRRFALARHRFAELGAITSAGECDANLATVLRAMGAADEAARYEERAREAGVGIPTAPGTSAQVNVTSLADSSDDQPVARSGSASA